MRPRGAGRLVLIVNVGVQWENSPSQLIPRTIQPRGEKNENQPRRSFADGSIVAVRHSDYVIEPGLRAGSQELCSSETRLQTLLRAINAQTRHRRQRLYAPSGRPGHRAGIFRPRQSGETTAG